MSFIARLRGDPGFWGNNTRVLFALANANMNITTDQVFEAIDAQFCNRYAITAVRFGSCPVSLTAAAGGVYTGAGKTGTIVVPAAQAYSGITGPTAVSVTGLAVPILTTKTMFLSLTTPQGAAAVMDFIFLAGFPID